MLGPDTLFQICIYSVNTQDPSYLMVSVPLYGCLWKWFVHFHVFLLHVVSFSMRDRLKTQSEDACCVFKGISWLQWELGHIISWLWGSFQPVRWSFTTSENPCSVLPGHFDGMDILLKIKLWKNALMSKVKYLWSRLCLLNLGANPITLHASQNRNENLPINLCKKEQTCWFLRQWCFNAQSA